MLFALVVFGALPITSASGQKLSGRVTDDEGPVGLASIVIRKALLPGNIYKFTTADSDGNYQLNIGPLKDSIIVDVSSPFHERHRIRLAWNESTGDVVRNFSLSQKNQVIDEVIVEATKRAITRKGDTVTYDIDSFKDGSERAVEDILKKLPGISVSATGDVRYNGRLIKKMLIDGDDLFDKQYKIGTKNISANIVDKVQAIEDFHENPHLKGIDASREVALNITLKKNKSDFSGNAYGGYGVKDRYVAGLSGLLVNGLAKTFAVSKINNIGENPGPYDLKSQFESEFQEDQVATRLQEYLQPGNIYSTVDNKHSNFNRNLFNSLSSIIKISPAVSARLNLGYYQDRLTRHLLQSSLVRTEADTISLFQEENLKIKPGIFDANLKLESKGNKKIVWEYLGKLQATNSDLWNASVNNFEQLLNKLDTKNLYTNHEGFLSMRLGDSLIWISNGMYSHDGLAQGYRIAAQDGARNFQSLDFKKSVFHITSDLYGVRGRFRWMGRLGFLQKEHELMSFLSPDLAPDLPEGDDFANDVTYSVTNPYAKFRFNYLSKKIDTEVSLGLNYLDLDYRDWQASRLTSSKFRVNSSVSVTYKINTKNSLSATYTLDNEDPRENYFLQGIVQTGFRDYVSNEASLQLLESHRAGLRFRHRYAMFSHFSVSADYTLHTNGYVTAIDVSLDNTFYRNFMSARDREMYEFRFFNTAYVHRLKATIDLDLGYSINRFVNLVNSTQVRQVQGDLFRSELTVKRALTTQIHLEAQSLFHLSKFSALGRADTRAEAFRQHIKLAFTNKKRFDANTTLNFMQPNLQGDEQYYFWNAQVTVRSKSNTFEYSLSAVNIFNHESFSIVRVTDFSRSASTQTLIQRYLMASVNITL